MRYEDLEKLNDLRQKGAITEEEYIREKEKILNQKEQPQPGANQPLGMSTNNYAMLLHLSQFTWVIVPLVLWLVGKEKSWEIDKHGRIVLNWLLSVFIYAVVFGILCIVLIGIPLIIALGICSVVFTIIGAIKASEGVFWVYPLSIPFFNINVEPRI